MRNKHLWTSLVVGLVIAGGAVASNVTLPNMFQPNTPARASEVNANFAAVKTAVDDNYSRVTALESSTQTSVTQLQSAITTLTNTDGQNWKRGGNTGTAVATDYIGTADNQTLEVRVNATRALQIIPASGAASVVFGGLQCPVSVASGVRGGFVGGGNAMGRLTACSTAERHRIYDHNVVIAGGFGNSAGSNDADMTNAEFASVGGGVFNNASGYASHVGGGDNNTASGAVAVVLGGYQNQATGSNSIAGGSRAIAAHGGAIVLSDASNGNFTSAVANQFAVRAAGGVYFGGGTSTVATIPAGAFIATSTGGYLSTGGAWTNSSDIAQKENLKPVTERAVLDAVKSLPVYTWNYRSEATATRHIGPTAQDFAQRFAVGGDDKHIATIDADGVALAAIKGLAQYVEEQKVVLEAQRKQIAELESRLKALESR